MQKKILISIVFSLLVNLSFCQTKNYIDQPFLETSAKVDTLVTPDRIYIKILITEKDTKGKLSVEEQENKMAQFLKSIDIDLNKQLFLADASSDFKKHFLKQKDILKNKSFTLVVYDGLTTGKVLMGLEKINISNVYIEKTTYSNMDALQLQLKIKAIEKAMLNANTITKPLNQSIGKAIYISDTGSNYKYENKSSNIRIRGMSSLSDSKFEPIDIDFEKIKVESKVFVKFRLN